MLFATSFFSWAFKKKKKTKKQMTLAMRKEGCETLLVTLDCDFGLVGIPVLPKRYDDGW